MREAVLKERLAGEVLEVRIVDPALTDPFVGQPEHVLEQQQADHEAALDAWSALVAVERRDLCVDPRPVDLAAKLHQLVLHVDYLVEPGSAKDSGLIQRLNPMQRFPLDANVRAFAGSTVATSHATSHAGVAALTPDEMYLFILNIDMGGQYFFRENLEDADKY